MQQSLAVYDTVLFEENIVYINNYQLLPQHTKRLVGNGRPSLNVTVRASKCRPKSANTSEIIEKVQDMILEDQRVIPDTYYCQKNTSVIFCQINCT